MRFTNTILAIVASTSLVLAAPADAAVLAQRDCPNGWYYCGVCNGNSCKIAASNWDCDDGTSCVGDGGGDGAICGSDKFAGSQICPVKT